MRDTINQTARRVPAWAVYLLGVAPLVWIVWQLVSGGYGPDPVRGVETELGQWGLKFLIASLVVTPLRWGGINLLKFRRAIGLLAFSYIVLHLAAWVSLDLGFRWEQIATDLYKRPYIVVGMTGLLARSCSTSQLLRLPPSKFKPPVHQLTRFCMGGTSKDASSKSL